VGPESHRAAPRREGHAALGSQTGRRLLRSADDEWRSPQIEPSLSAKQATIWPCLNREQDAAHRKRRSRTVGRKRALRWDCRVLLGAFGGARFCSAPQAIASHEAAEGSRPRPLRVSGVAVAGLPLFHHCALLLRDLALLLAYALWSRLGATAKPQPLPDQEPIGRGVRRSPAAVPAGQEPGAGPAAAGWPSSCNVCSGQGGRHSGAPHEGSSSCGSSRPP
jgi:hypothetical protein